MTRLTLKDIPMYTEFINNTDETFFKNGTVAKNITKLFANKRKTSMDFNKTLSKVLSSDIDVTVSFNPEFKFSVYNHKERTITMKRKGTHLLVHEFCHSIQDQLFGLACTFSRDYYIRYALVECCAECIAYLITDSDKYIAKKYITYWYKVALEIAKKSEFTKEQIDKVLVKRLNEQYQVAKQILN